MNHNRMYTVLLRLRRLSLRRLLALLLPTLFVAAPSIHAQEESWRLCYGMIAGGEWGAALGGFPVFAGSPGCGEFGSGTVASHWLGAAVGMRGAGFGAELRLSWAGISESFQALPIDPQLVYDPVANVTVELDRRYRFRSEIPLIRAELLGQYRLARDWSVNLGPWIGYRYGSMFSQRDTVVGPAQFRYDDGLQGREMAGGESFTARALALGIATGITYRAVALGRFSIEPELSARLELTSPVNEAVRRTLSAGIGVAVRYGGEVDAQVDAQGAVDPAVVPVAASADTGRDGGSPLRASIDLYCLSQGLPSDSSVIVARESVLRVYPEILPVIFFDRSSSSIPLRYDRLSTEQAGALLIDMSARFDPLPFYRSTIPILAMRMRADARSSITLRGHASSDEPAALATERSQAVRNYLTEIWKIDVNRIAIAPEQRATVRSDRMSEAEREEDRYVEIVPSDPALLTPIAVERTRRVFDPPAVRIKPLIDAVAGVRTWAITIRHAGREVARYANDHSVGVGEGGIMWDLVAHRSEHESAPLTAELIVEDSTGRVAVARDLLPLIFVPDGAGLDTVIEYVLSAPLRNAEVAPEAVGRIVEKIESGTRVVVTGYRSPDSEEAERVADRSRGIAEAVAVALASRGARNVEIVVAEPEERLLPVDDRSPEGRMLARGITITVRRQAADEGGER